MVVVTWIDVVLILIIFWSVATGLRSGLARVVVGFIAAIAAFLTGFWCYRLVAVKLAPYISNTTLADFAAFCIIFVGVLILGSITGAILSKLLHWVGLSWLNRLMGGAAGFVRGVLLIAALTDVLIAFAPFRTTEVLQHSLVVPYVTNVAGWLVDLAPRSLKDAFDQQMQQLRQYWLSPSNKTTQAV